MPVGRTPDAFTPEARWKACGAYHEQGLTAAASSRRDFALDIPRDVLAGVGEDRACKIGRSFRRDRLARESGELDNGN